jgi:hypothetical protein
MTRREATLLTFGNDAARLRKFIEAGEELFKPEALAEAKAILAEMEKVQRGVHNLCTAPAGNGWIDIAFDLDGKHYAAEAKVFDVGSQYGINRGRISKLCIRRTGDGVVYQYDRGSVFSPADADAIEAKNIIVNLFK